MNIAILIGISKYRANAPLPACSKDVKEMHRLLSSTKKYDDIFCISSNTEAASVKDSLRSFFARYRDPGQVQEALVYFSGHGMYHNDALFCCSDFDPNRPASTSLSNSELDDLLRCVAPDVAVKVLDACQSGSPYIKDAAPGFEKALRESRLKAFFCMASSRTDQSSYATRECSLFTARFIDAALSRPAGRTLYRDIQAALADSFVANPDQTPYFVSQGSGLEVFANVTPEMLSLRSLREAAQASTKAEDTAADAIAQEVSRMDSFYLSQEEAYQAIERARASLEETPLSLNRVSQFYEKSTSFEGGLNGLPGANTIAVFARDQGWEKKYFVRISWRSVVVEVPRNPIGGALGRVGDPELVRRTIKRPSRLKATQALPFEVAEVSLEPKGHPSLRSFKLYIGLAHSLTELVVLSATARSLETGWTERAIDASQLKWRHRNHLWKNVAADPELVWREPLGQVEETIEAYLEGLVPRAEDPGQVEPEDKNEGTRD